MAPQRSIAVAWKYVKKEGSEVICQLCGHTFTATLTRVVDHLLCISNGNGGGVEGCQGISDAQKDDVRKDYEKTKAERGKREIKRQRIMREINMSSSSSIPGFSSNVCGSSSTPSKTGGTTTLNAFWKPVERQEVNIAFAEMFYACAIPFNVARNPYFKAAISKAAAFGKGYVPPGSEALRTSLLRKTKERVTNRLAEIKESWTTTGCTILSDGWSDSCHRPLINVLVYSPRGIYFVKVVDAMDHMKTA